MQLRLLGPVRAELGGRAVNLGVRMQRFVLAVLALEANRLVTTERLVDLTWPADPPRTARRIIHSQVSRLRATLAAASANAPDGTGAPAGAAGPVTIRGDGPGYVLDCPADRIDVHRFTGLLSRAQHTDDDRIRLELLDEALALWQGPFLAGTASEATRTLLGGHLAEARLGAVEDRLAALLRQGDHLRVLDEARRLAAEHPDRQRLVGHLMLALHGVGRTVEALGVYRQAKERFADEFGLDPPAELRQLETAILRDDRDPAPAADRRSGTARCRPAQLPTDVPGFTGRVGQLA
ncbi:AfsR/SARP family transcriptional regulator, partial [Plantactinospora sp. CA-290183]|uniref:AfsR/SARP family transcriptional regulator n=1 Tax=Plantactinospora sp. CA-290183 TaxID=3240006 RepID=UPI003D8E1DFD